MLRDPSRLAQMALAWVWTTALGLLVVPDVNMIPNGRSGSAGRPGQASASPNRSSKESRLSPDRSAAVGSSASSPVTATHWRSGPAATTIDAYLGWVMAATHWDLSMK